MATLNPVGSSAMRSRQPQRTLSIVMLAVGTAELLVATLMAALGNPEGWLGGLLFGLLYAVPLLLLGAMLRSTRAWLRKTAGWAALLLVIGLAALLPANWDGYSPAQATMAVVLTVPVVVVGLVAFWVTVGARTVEFLVTAVGARRTRLV